MNEDVFRFCDDVGPAETVHIYNPALGLKAIVVVDNVAAGPAIGGTRMEPDVTLEECVRLARAMTLKNVRKSQPDTVAINRFWGSPTRVQTPPSAVPTAPCMTRLRRKARNVSRSSRWNSMT